MRSKRESFFATLECELLDRERFRMPAEARRAVFDYIEGWYNPRRRHSALGYESPVRYERLHAARALRAAAPETPSGVEAPGSTRREGVLPPYRSHWLDAPRQAGSKSALAPRRSRRREGKFFHKIPRLAAPVSLKHLPSDTGDEMSLHVIPSRCLHVGLSGWRSLSAKSRMNLALTPGRHR
jgi:Integrase core domain